MKTETLVVLGEYCHDWPQRYTPLVAPVRKQFPGRRVVGVMWLAGKNYRPTPELAPFDDLHFVADAPGAVALALGTSNNGLITFFDHNPGGNDCTLYDALSHNMQGVILLFRNCLHVADWLATGKDNRDAIVHNLPAVRRDVRSEAIKASLIAGVVALVVGWGKLVRFLSRSERVAPRRILFIRLDLLGDMALTLPYLAAMKKCYPEAELTVLASPRGAALLKGLPQLTNMRLFDHLEVWDAPWHRMRPAAMGLKELFEMLGRLPSLWRRNFDLVFQPVNFGTGIAFALLCLGKRTVAPIDHRLPVSRAVGGLLSDPVAVPQDKILHIDDFLSLCIEKAGVAVQSVVPALPVDPAAMKKMRALICRNQERVQRRVVLVNVGAGSKLRRWGAEKFAALIDLLLQESFTVIVTGGESERGIAEQVENLVEGRIINTAGVLSLNELIAITTLADLVITADTALMHFAAALERPLIALFGAGLVDYCRPLNTNHLLVRRELGCSGCRDRCFTDNYPPPCLERVTPEKIFQAIRDMKNE